MTILAVHIVHACNVLHEQPTVRAQQHLEETTPAKNQFFGNTAPIRY